MNYSYHYISAFVVTFLFTMYEGNDSIEP